jgi:hypothetical protein
VTRKKPEDDDTDGVRKRPTMVKLDETHHHGRLQEDGGSNFKKMVATGKNNTACHKVIHFPDLTET